jgi:hypothetical protein
MKRRAASKTQQPETEMHLLMPELTDDQWGSVGETAMMLVEIALGNRSGLDSALDLWDSMYEMATEERDNPYPESSSFVSPIVAAECDELRARLVATILQDRLLTVRGNDPQAAQYSHIIEEFYCNSVRDNGWDEVIDSAIMLSILNGTAVGEALWDMTTHSELVVVDETDPATGQTSKVKKWVKYVDFSGVRWNAVELRDFVLYPAHAPSIQKADLVARKLYMSEHELRAMQEAGVFPEERVNMAVAFNNAAEGDQSWDRQGNATYTAAGRINVVDTSVAPPVGMKMAVGPTQVWRIHTNLLDLDGDGFPEENILWVQDRSRRLIGFAPFEYPGGRPFKPLSLIRRPNRFLGIGFPERLKPIQDEIDSIHNGRLQWLDMCTNPDRYKVEGVRTDDETRRQGPQKEWIVPQGPNDVGFIKLGDSPPSADQEESRLLQYAAKITGAPQASSLASSSGSGGKVSARAAQSITAIQQMQTNMSLQNIRKWICEMVEYSHGLNIKYGPSQMEVVANSNGGPRKLIIPKELFALDYKFGVVGQGGPLDKETRRQDILLLVRLIDQSPTLSAFVKGNPQHMWTISRMVLETFDIPEVTAIIGTMEEGVQHFEAQAKAQAEQEQQQMLMQLMSHSKIGPKGAPSGGQAQPPGGAQ